MKKIVKKKEKNLWAGRFKENPSKLMVDMNASIHFDNKLYVQDILSSKQHAQMLSNNSIITTSEGKKIIDGLEKVKIEMDKGKIAFDPILEDIHTHIEKRLIELIGPVAKKLHTARSRNDQVITSLKMWIRDQNTKLDNLLQRLQVELIHQAENHFDTIMPGFTHLQPAQPVTLGHHLLAYVNMFGRDRENLWALVRHNKSPLGSAALAGTSFKINRDETSSSLGFNGIMRNSLDAVSDRDFILDTLNLCCSIFVHMSRIAEEIILWNSPGFNFISLPDAFSTGSSIMPQKRNPDAAELIRGKSGRILGNYVAVFNLMKALPLSYSKDMQEDKEPIFDSMENTIKCINILSEMINTIKFNKKSMREMTNEGYITATDIADWLVQELKLKFRDAHKITGEIVAFAENNNTKLHLLKIKDLKKIEPKINNKIYNIIKVKSSVSSRNSQGGTSPSEVKKEIILAKDKWIR